MAKTVYEMYFSPTGTTKKVIHTIAQELIRHQKLSRRSTIDFTPLKERTRCTSFKEGDIVIFGVPVVAGRVPNVLLKYLKTIRGNGALAVAVVVYGNRNYDDALIELRDILDACNFQVIAGAAFIGEHSFSKILAKGRPDEKDLKIASSFAHQIAQKLMHKTHSTPNVKGSKPYRDYYKPKDKNGQDVDIRKVVPKTKDTCIDCKLCAKVCPMGSIDFEDVHKLNGICIKCCACIKKCPTNSKYFDDVNYLNHKYELERNFINRREPEFFL